MANNVTAVQIGAQPKVFNGIDTVSELLQALDLEGVSIKINGETVGDDHTLSDYDFVSFGEKVKGGY
jgi:hypothetical protein